MMSEELVIKWPAYVWCRVVKKKPKDEPSPEASPVIKAGKRPPKLTEATQDAASEGKGKLYVDFSTEGLYSIDQADAWKAEHASWFDDAETYHLILVRAG